MLLLTFQTFKFEEGVLYPTGESITFPPAALLCIRDYGSHRHVMLAGGEKFFSNLSEQDFRAKFGQWEEGLNG